MEALRRRFFRARVEDIFIEIFKKDSAMLNIPYPPKIQPTYEQLEAENKKLREYKRNVRKSMKSLERKMLEYKRLYIQGVHTLTLNEIRIRVLSRPFWKRLFS